MGKGRRSLDFPIVSATRETPSSGSLGTFPRIYDLAVAWTVTKDAAWCYRQEIRPLFLKEDANR